VLSQRSRCLLQFLLHNLNAQSSKPLPIPEVLNKTFLDVDNELSKLANAEKTHSGCTAVVAFLRLEDDDDGRKSSSSDDASAAKVHSKSLENVPSREEQQRVNVGGLDPTPGPGEHEDDAEGGVAGSKREKVRSVLGKLTGKSTTDDKKNSSTESSFVPVVRKIDAKRVLYTANVGDARAVISWVLRQP
jgi:protein phosphatase PTC1